MWFESSTKQKYIEENHCKEKLKSVTIKNQRPGKIDITKTDGVFIFWGSIPNTEFIEDNIALNKYKELIVNQDMSTNMPGVCAAGDSIAKRFRQVTSAVGKGTIAELSIYRILFERNTHK